MCVLVCVSVCSSQGKLREKEKKKNLAGIELKHSGLTLCQQQHIF